MSYLTSAIYLLVTIIVFWMFFANQSPQRSDETEPIRFLSLAWQTQSIAVNKRIISEWNTLHPDIPVEYIEGNWKVMHDYLVTGFETGDLPDIFHYESSGLVDFALRGNLANLAPFIPTEMKTDIIDLAWDLVTRSNGEVVGIPFLIEPVINIYNKDLFDKAGIVAPGFENPWSWDDFRAAARKLTLDHDSDGRIDQWGAAMGLRTPGYRIMAMSPGFGGTFFYEEDGKPVFRVTQAEKRLIGTLYEMLHEDRILAPASVGSSVSSLVPGFFMAKYAVLFQVGVYLRQQMVENAPDGFRWGVFPNPRSVTQKVGTSGQTLSIPKACTRPRESMAFIEYFLGTQNMAELARGDWEAPTRKSCFELPGFQTTDDGWKATIQAVAYAEAIGFKGIPGFREWETRAANPIFQELFAGRLSLDEACERLENASNQVLRRYQNRKEQW